MVLFRSFILVVLLAAIPSTAFAKCNESNLAVLRDHVFKLTVSFPGGRTIQQTAFRVAGWDGLFTALHGVMGARLIQATRSDAKSQIQEEYSYLRRNALEINAYDWAADLAFLVPEDGEFPATGSNAVAGSGLQVKTDRDFATIGAPVDSPGCTIGFPEGVQSRLDHNVVLRREIKLLDDAIGEVAETEDLLGYLEAVRSPNLNRKVFSIQSNVRKGDSGAPIVGADDQVIGFVDGGYSIGLNWAIPLASTCFFRAGGVRCRGGAPSADDLSRIQAALEKFADGQDSMYATARLRVPLAFGAMVAGPVHDPYLGPLRDIETRAEFESCTRIKMNVRMTNRDKVFGFCFSPRLDLYGNDSTTPLNAGAKPQLGRLCLGAVLEDEALLRLWDMVSAEGLRGPVRTLLGIDASAFEKLKSARDDICKTRADRDHPCKPYRQEEQGTWTPPYVTERFEQDRILDLKDTPICDADGNSQLYSMRWVYEPAKKPDGMFEALDRAEDAVQQAAKLGPLAAGIADSVKVCQNKENPQACALFELAKLFAFQ